MLLRIIIVYFAHFEFVVCGKNVTIVTLHDYSNA